jgi:CBS domain containing-hemolysin-like protein
LKLVVLVLSLGVSFVLSGMETGLFSLNRLRLRHLMRQGDKRARQLCGYLQQPERCLWTILVGNILAAFVTLTLMVLQLRQWLVGHPGLWVIGVLVAAFLLYALVDLLPKMLFRRSPTAASLACVGFYNWIHRLLAPVVTLVAWLAGLLLWATGGRRFTGRMFGNREELWLVMQESGPGLTHDERSMVQRVLGLQTTTVGALTVPLSQVTVLDETTPAAEVFALCREQPRNRFPLKDPHTGRITGCLNLSDLLYAEDLSPESPVEPLARAVVFLKESDFVETALQRFRRTGHRFAIVTDRDEREVGVLSLEDILRHIFGRLTL